jgi:four helix bundle protein
MENGETEVWLGFAKDCNYLSKEKHQQLYALNEEVAKLLSFMINHPEKFL